MDGLAEMFAFIFMGPPAGNKGTTSCWAASRVCGNVKPNHDGESKMEAGCCGGRECKAGLGPGRRQEIENATAIGPLQRNTCRRKHQGACDDIRGSAGGASRLTGQIKATTGEATTGENSRVS